MEDLITFTGIVVIVFGILQIILFFKVWGMTNNVKRIWKKIDNKDFLSDACVSYIKGNLEETERLANEAFLQEVALLSKSSESYEDWLNGYKELKDKYTRLFKKIDKPAPDFDKYEIAYFETREEAAKAMKESEKYNVINGIPVILEVLE